MPRCTLGLLPRSDLDDLDQAATWTCGMNTAARRARELAATGEGIAREKESAHATRERIFREDESFTDKNSWVYYFGKCQVKNVKHLEIILFFSFSKTSRDLTNFNK